MVMCRWRLKVGGARTAPRSWPAWSRPRDCATVLVRPWNLGPAWLAWTHLAGPSVTCPRLRVGLQALSLPSPQMSRWSRWCQWTPQQSRPCLSPAMSRSVPGRSRMHHGSGATLREARPPWTPVSLRPWTPLRLRLPAQLAARAARPHQACLLILRASRHRPNELGRRVVLLPAVPGAHGARHRRPQGCSWRRCRTKRST
mmetsp:Transcript_3819/g.11217  ORF Transcript_3819/g.11217 Transcript_3819/m.11217 type:complete len:200 (+) Transcript_3819:467-1066(+)